VRQKTQGHSSHQTSRALRQGGPKPLQELFTARSPQHAARQFILYSPLSDNIPITGYCQAQKQRVRFKTCFYTGFRV